MQHLHCLILFKRSLVYSCRKHEDVLGAETGTAPFSSVSFATWSLLGIVTQEHISPGSGKGRLYKCFRSADASSWRLYLEDFFFPIADWTNGFWGSVQNHQRGIQYTISWHSYFPYHFVRLIIIMLISLNSPVFADWIHGGSMCVCVCARARSHVARSWVGLRLAAPNIYNINFPNQRDSHCSSKLCHTLQRHRVASCRLYFPLARVYTICLFFCIVLCKYSFLIELPSCRGKMIGVRIVTLYCMPRFEADSVSPLPWLYIWPSPPGASDPVCCWCFVCYSQIKHVKNVIALLYELY